ncbi:MAG: hypothetical protein AAF638_08255 [Pseudomonadota bacterium]
MARRTKSERRRDGPIVPEIKPPDTIVLTARRSVMIPIIVLSLMGLVAVSLLALQPGLAGGALMGAGLLAINMFYAIQALLTRTLVELGTDTARIMRNEKVLYDGPYYGVKKTVLPALGAGIAVPPLPMGTTLSLAFSHPFGVNAARHRIAFPGVFVAGIDGLLAKAPADKRI